MAEQKPASGAEEAVDALLRHQRFGAALENHLADPILLPLAFPGLPSAFTTEAVAAHLETNALVIEQFGLTRISIQRRDDGTAIVCQSIANSTSVGSCDTQEQTAPVVAIEMPHGPL